MKDLCLRGDKVQCPCCGKRFQCFLPSGHPPRPHAQCPHCHSLERQRLVWLYLKNESTLFSREHRILHVAPEKALMRQFVKQANISYQAIDMFTAPQYKYAKVTRVMDVGRMSFEDSSFDFALCMHVLEHVDDDRQAMCEIHRSLRPGAFAILQVPIDATRKQTYEDPAITGPREREKAFGQDDHVRLYGLDYKNRLEEAGFRVEVVDYYGRFTKEEVFRYGLVKDDLYICKKQ